MALIPVSYKLSFYDPSKPGGIITVQEDNANLATSLATQFSMQDIMDTIGNDGLSKIWIMIPDDTTFLSPVPDTNIIRLANEEVVNASAIKIGETIDFQASTVGGSHINQLRYAEVQFTGTGVGGFHQLVNSEFRVDIDNGGGGDIYASTAGVFRSRARGIAPKAITALYGINATSEVEDTGVTNVEFQICLRTANKTLNPLATTAFMYGWYYGMGTADAGKVTDHRAIFIDIDAASIAPHTDYCGLWHDTGPLTVSGNKYFINNLMDAPIQTAGGMTFTNSLPAFADDAAAGALTTGQLYQTDGAGAAPLNAVGIVMIKQ